LSVTTASIVDVASIILFCVRLFSAETLAAGEKAQVEKGKYVKRHRRRSLLAELSASDPARPILTPGELAWVSDAMGGAELSTPKVRRCRLTLSKTTLKAPGPKHLNLECDKLLSTSALKSHLRRYTKVLYDMDDDPKRSATLWLDSCARHTLKGGREMLVVVVELNTGKKVVGRGLHSSTLQLNLSRFEHEIHPIIPPNIP
jgi:hypothetical protein